MQFDIQIHKLSDKFMQDHPSAEYPEITTKANRPHCCLLIDTHRDYFICIPYRSHIHHKNAYLFSDSERSRRDHSGLDYTKIAIIKDTDYFSTKPARVDDDEYRETINNSRHIVSNAVKYVDTYVNHENGSAPLSPEKFKRAYKYTTLKYYHAELGIDRTADRSNIKTDDKTLSEDNVADDAKQNSKTQNNTVNSTRFDDIINQKVCEESYVTPTNHFGDVEYS